MRESRRCDIDRSGERFQQHPLAVEGGKRLGWVPTGVTEKVCT
jgi:hypothetical protein